MCPTAKQLRSQTLGAAEPEGRRGHQWWGASGPQMVPPRPGAHLHRRAPSGAGSACPARVCRRIGSTAWHGTALSRQGSPAGTARWGNRAWNVEPMGPCCAVLCYAVLWTAACQRTMRALGGFQLIYLLSGCAFRLFPGPFLSYAVATPVKNCIPC